MLNEHNEKVEEKKEKEGVTKLVRKQLLRHQPAVAPTQPFNINEMEKEKEKELNASQPATQKEKKNMIHDTISSLRVRKSTRNKVNALINLGKADSADMLVDIAIDEYINSLAKEERKTFEMLYQVLQNRK